MSTTNDYVNMMDSNRLPPEGEVARNTVAGLFRARADALRAVDDLKVSGFAGEDIGIAMRDRSEQDQLIEETGTGAAEAAATGAVGGGLLGGIAGLLVGIGALAIPGVGPILAGGVLASTLAGAGIGAATGGILGALVGMGIPEEQARYYEEGFRSGGVLVTVNAGTRAKQARLILKRHGADTGLDDHVEPGLTTPGAYAAAGAVRDPIAQETDTTTTAGGSTTSQRTVTDVGGSMERSSSQSGIDTPSYQGLGEAELEDTGGIGRGGNIAGSRSGTASRTVDDLGAGMDISGAESRTTDKTYQGLGEAGMEDVSTAGQGTTSDSRLDLDQIDTSPIHTRANAGPSVGTGIGSGEFGTPGPAGADFAGGGQDTTPAGAGSRRGVGVYEDTPVPSVAGEDGTYTGVAQGTGQPTLTEDTAFPRSDPGEGTAYHGVAENEEA